MRFEGRVFRSGAWWAIEVKLLDIYTQGRTRTEAFEMLEHAAQTLADDDRLELEFFSGRGESFEVGSPDTGALCALVLKRQCQAQRLTLADVSKRLQMKSTNAYARYEQGRAVPTVKKFEQLLNAVNPEIELVLAEK